LASDRAYLAECTDLDPKEKQAGLLGEIGNALIHQSKYADAIPILKRCISINKDEAMCWEKLGEANANLHRRTEAKMCWKTTLEIGGFTEMNALAVDEAKLELAALENLERTMGNDLPPDASGAPSTESLTFQQTALPSGNPSLPLAEQPMSSPALRTSQRFDCQRAIIFAVATKSGLVYRLPDVSSKWFEKTQKKYTNTCFSQYGVHSGSAAGEKNYLVVLSTSKAAFNGLLPVYRTNTSSSTSPITGSGTITDNFGATWNYTYQGTMTTTTTTTTQTDVPYTDTTVGLYANAYSEKGALVGEAERATTRRQGGDAGNTLGYNLGAALGSMHIKEHLLESIVKQVSSLP
jgi:hypothetical protein